MEKASGDLVKEESHWMQLIRQEYMNIRQSEFDKKAEGVKVQSDVSLLLFNLYSSP